MKKQSIRIALSAMKQPPSIPYGKEDLLIADLDLTKATRLYAKRYHPEWYPA